MSSKRQQKITGWQRLANFFGVLGYVSVLIEWTWIVALYLPLLIENESIKQLLLPDQSARPEEAIATNSEPSLFLIGIAVTITFVVVVASILLLVRLPLKIARTGHKAVEKTAIASLPVLTHHKTISKKRKKILTARIIAWLKIIGVTAPLAAVCGAYLVDLQLPREIVVLVAVVLAISALANFTLQYLIARWRSIPSEQLL